MTINFEKIPYILDVTGLIESGVGQCKEKNVLGS